MAPQHFLVVTFSGQGNINPSRALALRLARATGERVTLSAAVAMHRLMFPDLAAPDEEVHDGVVSYVPYSDGYDHCFSWFDYYKRNAREYMDKLARVGRESLSGVLDRLAARGRPVTCVVYNIMMWWAGEVAGVRGVPGVLYWVQPATILAVYYRYFHGYEKLVTEHAADPGFTVAMPGLPPMAIRDLPSFFTNLTDPTMAAVLHGLRRTIEQLDVERSSSSSSTDKAVVLVNTVEELEAGALTSVPELDILPIGPAVLSLAGDGDVDDTWNGTAMVRDLHQQDEQTYMEWLNTKPRGSVVYVSFGSLSTMSKRQKEEMKLGLAASGRPYLWVVRKNNRDDGVPVHDELERQGMVVEWCHQVRVLSHPAIGCFVTHCGWNSTLESVTCGVPMVAMPQWTDQNTNALLVVEWGVGVRAAVAADGVLEAEELKSCLEMVMGDTEGGVGIRRSSAAWKAKVREAITEGSSSDRNLKTFLDQIANGP